MKWMDDVQFTNLILFQQSFNSEMLNNTIQHNKKNQIITKKRNKDLCVFYYYVINTAFGYYSKKVKLMFV